MTAPKTIILLVIDTLRADHLGYCGYRRATSPSIDAFAARSIVFTHAFTPVSYTLPAIASMLASKMPENHGIGFSQIGKMSEDSDLTLAEILRDNGFATAAFVSTIILNKSTKLDAGFDVYDDDMTATELNRPECLVRDGRETIGKALEYIGRNKGKNLFAFIHLIDVHGPYSSPSPYDRMFIGDSFYGTESWLPVVADNHPYRGIPAYQVLRAPGAAHGEDSGPIHDPRYYCACYDGGIRNCDDIVARLFTGLKELGIYDDTFFILTADHGEALGENGIYFSHGITVTPEQIAVPMIIKFPGSSFSGPETLSSHVSIMDLMPTILLACGIDSAGLGLVGLPLQHLIERGEDSRISARTLLCQNECQDALVRPGGELDLQLSTRPFQYHYAFVPEVLHRLDGRRYDWRTGKPLAGIGLFRKLRMRQLRQVIRDEPDSAKKLMRMAYLTGSLFLPHTAKSRILALAPWLRTRLGHFPDTALHSKPDEKKATQNRIEQGGNDPPNS